MKSESAGESLDVATTSALGPFNKFMTMLKNNEKLHVAWCVTGIVGCLLLYGVLQERIIAEEYGPPGEGERFTATLFIVMCNRLVTSFIAGFLLMVSGQSVLPQAPMWNYVAVSASNVVATFCQYEALKYVSFPVATLGKCAKMIPVMIWGSFVNQKTYKAKDYGIALMVTGGCVMFIMTGKISSKAASQSLMDSSVFGCLLMVGYLGFDGFTSTWQDRMFKGYSMSVYNQILYVQLCSACVSFTSLIAFGQLLPALSFLVRHPDCMWNIMLLSVAATIGQLFIFHTIKTFGALLFATVMTTRQFLSILLSCFMFLHPLTFGQTVATLVVFGTLYYKNLSSQKHKESIKSTPPPNEEDPKANIAGPTESQSALERLMAAGK